MSQLQPPSYQNLKRKRSTTSVSSRASSINPHSHSPSLLSQLSLAGLSETDTLPATPGFPHRPLPKDPLYPPEDASDPATSAPETSSRQHRTNVLRARRAHDRSVGRLVDALHQHLARSDIAAAKRAFGLLTRADVGGRAVDLRTGMYWAIGAEILMREGETAGEARRWGSAANAVRVREWYEFLIRAYPWNRQYPGAVGALTFWPVMVGVEVYNVWVEGRLALGGLEEEMEGWEDEDGSMMEVEERPGAYEFRGDDENVAVSARDRGLRPGSREARLREEKEKIRTRSLKEMLDIAKRMDAVMESAPYSSNHEMLRLRAMIALYMGDLSVPTSPRTDTEEREGQAKRGKEQDRAKVMFRKILEEKGDLEDTIMQYVRAEHDKEEIPRPSVLTIRTAAP